MGSQRAAKGQAEGRLRAGSGQAEGSQRAASIEYIEQIEDIEQIEQIDRERKTAQRFTPPTRDEVEIFCLENGLTIDVDRFVDYYTANGWMAGRNKMKDWQATVRNWARRSEDRPASAPVRKEPVKKVTAQNYEQRDYQSVQDEIERKQAEMIMARLRTEGGSA